MEKKETFSNREKLLITLLVTVTSVLCIVAGLWLRASLKENTNKEQIIEKDVTDRTGHEYTYTDYDLGIDVTLSPAWHFKLPDKENSGKFVFWAANDNNSTDSVITLNTTTYTDEIEALEKEKNGWAGYGESFSTIQVNILGEKRTGYVVYNATPEEHYTGVTYVPLSINGSVYMLYGFTYGTISDAEQILNYCSISYLDGLEQSVITNDQNKKHGKIIVLPEDPYIPETQKEEDLEE